MFDKYGEFDSVEELNIAAKGFKDEGDLDSLREMALENGIVVEDIEDYIAGYTEELATISMAAYARIEIMEIEEKKKKGESERRAISVIAKMLKGMATNEEMQVAIMRKGKRLGKVMNELKAAAGRHKDGNIGVSCGTDRELCSIIEAYYKTGVDAMKQQIEKLYK